MTTPAVTHSVQRATALPANVEELEAALQQLRQRFPRAEFLRYLSQVPVIADGAYVAPTAALIGDVRLAAETSVWFGCVLRADINSIEVRERSNVQDGTVIHLGDNNGTFIAEEVVVGHRAVLHGCHIGGGCLIGIGATVLDAARVGEGSIVAAGALVTAGTVIPPHSLVMGTPARVVKTLDAAGEAHHRELAGKYTRLAHNYLRG